MLEGCTFHIVSLITRFDLLRFISVFVFPRLSLNSAEEYNVPFIERNIMKNPPTQLEFQKMMALTVSGTDEIISTRSKAFQKLGIDINDLSLHELHDLIQEHPEILRKPIIMDQRRIQIGYNESEIRQFVPKRIRRKQLNKAQAMIANFEGTT